MSKLSSSKFWHSEHKAVRMHYCCFVVKAPANAIMHQKPKTKPILTYFTKCIAVQPSMAEYEWTIYQIKVDYCYHTLKSVLLYSPPPSILTNLKSNLGSFYAIQSSYLLKTWKKVILTCFTKIIAEQSSVIQYAWPMCHNKRGIIILLFPDISFVILLFIFQGFLNKPGFPFFL